MTIKALISTGSPHSQSGDNSCINCWLTAQSWMLDQICEGCYLNLVGKSLFLWLCHIFSSDTTAQGFLNVEFVTVLKCNASLRFSSEAISNMRHSPFPHEKRHISSVSSASVPSDWFRALIPHACRRGPLKGVQIGRLSSKCIKDNMYPLTTADSSALQR